MKQRILSSFAVQTFFGGVALFPSSAVKSLSYFLMQHFTATCNRLKYPQTEKCITLSGCWKCVTSHMNSWTPSGTSTRVCVCANTKCETTFSTENQFITCCVLIDCLKSDLLLDTVWFLMDSVSGHVELLLVNTELSLWAPSCPYIIHHDSPSVHWWFSSCWLSGHRFAFVCEWNP